MSARKVGVIGNTGVGKDCFLEKLAGFQAPVDDVLSLKMQVGDKEVDLLLEQSMDMNEPEYQSVNTAIIRGCDAFIMMFSVTDRRSMEDMASYIDSILRVKDVDTFPMVIVGTKADLVDTREVTDVEAREFAQVFNLEYYETCAAVSDQNVKSAVESVVKKLTAVTNRDEYYEVAVRPVMPLAVFYACVCCPLFIVGFFGKNIFRGGSIVPWEWFPGHRIEQRLRRHGGGKKKPILYLYPTNDNTQVRLTLESSMRSEGAEVIATCYPSVTKTSETTCHWNVIANRDGLLEHKTATNSRQLAYLFWETDFLNSFNSEKESVHWWINHVQTIEETENRLSFVSHVHKSDYIDHLESCLEHLGMNYREMNDFIVYWLPVLSELDAAYIQFELTTAAQPQGHLRVDIRPCPQQHLRIMMYFKEATSDHAQGNWKDMISTIPKTLRHSDQFLAIEWGGCKF